MSRVSASLQFFDLTVQPNHGKTQNKKQISAAQKQGAAKPFQQSYIEYIDHQQQFLKSNARNLSSATKSLSAQPERERDFLDYPRPWLNPRPLPEQNRVRFTCPNSAPNGHSKQLSKSVEIQQSTLSKNDLNFSTRKTQLTPSSVEQLDMTDVQYFIQLRDQIFGTKLGLTTIRNIPSTSKMNLSAAQHVSIVQEPYEELFNPFAPIPQGEVWWFGKSTAQSSREEQSDHEELVRASRILMGKSYH